MMLKSKQLDRIVQCHRNPQSVVSRHVQFRVLPGSHTSSAARRPCVRLVSAFAAIALHFGKSGGGPDVMEISLYAANLASPSCLVLSRVQVHGQPADLMPHGSHTSVAIAISSRLLCFQFFCCGIVRCEHVVFTRIGLGTRRPACVPDDDQRPQGAVAVLAWPEVRVRLVD